MVLYRGQKFRPAALWENNGTGRAGNIVVQADKLPDICCVCDILLFLFISFNQ